MSGIGISEVAHTHSYGYIAKETIKHHIFVNKK